MTALFPNPDLPAVEDRLLDILDLAAGWNSDTLDESDRFSLIAKWAAEARDLLRREP